VLVDSCCQCTEDGLHSAPSGTEFSCVDMCLLTVVVSALKTDFTVLLAARVEVVRACLPAFVRELVSVVSRSSMPVVTCLRFMHTVLFHCLINIVIIIIVNVIRVPYSLNKV